MIPVPAGLAHGGPALVPAPPVTVPARWPGGVGNRLAQRITDGNKRVFSLGARWKKDR